MLLAYKLAAEQVAVAADGQQMAVAARLYAAGTTASAPIAAAVEERAGGSGGGVGALFIPAECCHRHCQRVFEDAWVCGWETLSGEIYGLRASLA